MTRVNMAFIATSAYDFLSLEDKLWFENIEGINLIRVPLESKRKRTIESTRLIPYLEELDADIYVWCNISPLNRDYTSSSPYGKNSNLVTVFERNAVLGPRSIVINPSHLTQVLFEQASVPYIVTQMDLLFREHILPLMIDKGIPGASSVKEVLAQREIWNLGYSEVAGLLFGEPVLQKGGISLFYDQRSGVHYLVSLENLVKVKREDEVAILARVLSKGYIMIKDLVNDTELTEILEQDQGKELSEEEIKIIIENRWNHLKRRFEVNSINPIYMRTRRLSMSDESAYFVGDALARLCPEHEKRWHHYKWRYNPYTGWAEIPRGHGVSSIAEPMIKPEMLVYDFLVSNSGQVFRKPRIASEIGYSSIAKVSDLFRRVQEISEEDSSNPRYLFSIVGGANQGFFARNPDKEHRWLDLSYMDEGIFFSGSKMVVLGRATFEFFKFLRDRGGEADFDELQKHFDESRDNINRYFFRLQGKLGELTGRRDYVRREIKKGSTLRYWLKNNDSR